MSSKTLLVTGANGFLGRSLLKALHSTSFNVITTDTSGKVDFCGDLSTFEFVSTLPNVDTVIHCAAVQYVSTDLPLFTRKKYFERNNVTVARNLAKRFSGSVNMFINVGTSMMYDNKAQSPILPTTMHTGNGVYSDSKTQAWELISQMNNPTALMVPCIIAGPGRGGLFVDLITSIQKRNVSVCPGKGNSLTQMVHVDDAAALLVKIAESHAEGIFNAGGNFPLSINDWILTIRETLGKDKGRSFHVPLLAIELLSWLTNYRLLAKEQVSMLRGDHVLDTSSSEKLGWKPQHTNKEIIISTAKTYL